jgi:hypothetical protein
VISTLRVPDLPGTGGAKTAKGVAPRRSGVLQLHKRLRRRRVPHNRFQAERPRDQLQLIRRPQLHKRLRRQRVPHNRFQAERPRDQLQLIARILGSPGMSVGQFVARS